MKWTRQQWLTQAMQMEAARTRVALSAARVIRRRVDRYQQQFGSRYFYEMDLSNELMKVILSGGGYGGEDDDAEV